MTQPVRQPSLAPTRKIAATGITGLVATVLVLVADAFGYELDPALAAALVGAAAFVVGYLTKSKAPTFEDGARNLGVPPPTRLRRDRGDD